MKSFFSRLHDSQTGHSKSASRETYKFWTPNADAERNAARTIATSVETERPPLETRPPSRSQKLSHFYRKPTHEKPLPTTYTSTPAEKTSASSSRPNPGSSSTHVYVQPPPKASSSRHPDVRDVKPQANTYPYTGLVQPQSTDYPNPTPVVQHELWIPPSAVHSMSRPGENKRPPSRSHEKYAAHERYRSRDEEREAPRESGRRDRDKERTKKDREQERVRESDGEREHTRNYRDRERDARGRDSDREGRREREGDRNRDREREREEKDRLRQLEREQEYAKEAEREKELKENAKERERRQLEKERERQEEKERQEQEQKERERREQERERERRVQEMERERRAQERERERREQEKERERREQEKEREQMEQEKERERREQEKEQEQEKERERRERREKERNRHVERERREGDREMARDYHREKPRRDVERDGRRERENDVNNGSPGKKDRLREGETTYQRDTGEGRASRDHRKRDRDRDDTRYRAEATDGEDLMISRATRDKRQETGSGWVTDNQVNHGYKLSRQTQGTAPMQASRQNIVEPPKKIHKAPSRSEPPLVAQSQTSRPPIREPLRALQRDPLISEASQPVLKDPPLPLQPGHSQSNPIESQVVDEGESSDGSLKPVPLSKRTRTNDAGAQNLKAARSRQDRASRFMPPYNPSNQPQIASHEKPPVPATPRHMPVHLPPREARTIERAYQQSTTLPSTMENKIPDSAARREINRLRLHSRPEDLPVVPAEGVKALEPPLRPPSRTFGSSQNFVSPQMTVSYTAGANSASQLQQAQVPFEAQPRTTGAALSKIVKEAAQPQASSAAPQTLGASELAPSLPPSNVLGGSSQENRLRIWPSENQNFSDPSPASRTVLSPFSRDGGLSNVLQEPARPPSRTEQVLEKKLEIANLSARLASENQRGSNERRTESSSNPSQIYASRLAAASSQSRPLQGSLGMSLTLAQNRETTRPLRPIAPAPGSLASTPAVSQAIPHPSSYDHDGGLIPPATADPALNAVLSTRLPVLAEKANQDSGLTPFPSLGVDPQAVHGETAKKPHDTRQASTVRFRLDHSPQTGTLHGKTADLTLSPVVVVAKTDAAICMHVPTVQSTPLKPSINLEHGAYLGSDARHPSSSTSFRESSVKTPGPYQPATPTQLPINVFDLQSTVDHPNVSLPTNVPEGLDASSREPFSSNSSISRDNAAALPSNWDVRPQLAVPSDDRARSGRQDTTGMSISKSDTVTGFKQDAAKLGRILGHSPSTSTNIAPQLDKVQSSPFIRTAIGANTVDTTTETEGLGHSPCFLSTTSVQIPDAAQTVASMVGTKHMHVAIAPQMDSAKDGPSHVASATFQGNSKPMKQSTGYFVLPSKEPSGAPATRLVNDNTNRSTDNVVLQLPTPSSMKQEGFRELPRVEATPTQPHATFAASVDGPAHRSPGFRPSQEDSPRRVHVEQSSPRAVLQAAITPEVVPNPVRQGSGSKKDSPSWVSHSAIPNTESNPPMVRVPSNVPIISPTPRPNIYRTIPPSGSHATIDGTHQALSVGISALGSGPNVSKSTDNKLDRSESVRPQLAAQSDSSVWQSSTRLYTSTENAASSGQPRQEAARNTSTTIHSSDNSKPSNEATSPLANKRLSTAAHMLTGRHALDRPSTTPHNATPSTVHMGAPSGGQAYPGMNDSQQQLSTGVPKAEVVIEQGRLQKISDTDLLRSARPSLQPLPASLVRSARPSIQPLPSVTTQKHPYSNFASFQPSTTLSAHPQIHHPVLAEILSSPPLSKPFSIAQSGSTSRQHEVNHPRLEHHRTNTPVVNQVSISTRHPGHPFERVQIEDNQESRPSISKTPSFQNAFSNFQGKDVPSAQSGLDTTALMTNQVKLSPVQPPTIAPSTNTRPHQDSIRSSYGIMANIPSSTHAPQVPSGTWAPYPEGYASKTSLQPGVPSSATPYTQTFPSTISSHHPSRHQHSASLPINLTHPPAMNSSSSRTRTGPTVTQASQVQPSAPLPPTVEPTARNTLPDQVNATSSLPRTASEETILMTPSSLAQSMMLKPTTSRQSIAPSISSQTRKRVSLLSMFRKPPAPPPQPQPQPQPYEIWHPGTSNPESYSRYRSENAETFDRRYMSPVHRTSSADRNLSASNPSRTEKKSNKTDVFTPFRFLASKKNRSVSVASMEAQDGTAPSTVVGSPTTSIHSQVPFQIPSVRDPQRATEEWRDREEAGTKTRTKHKRRHPPGVVFDVSEETPENQQRQRYRGSRSRKLADNH